MSGKRRDSKNRILRNGESQRQDGRYTFKYIDATENSSLFIVGNWKKRTRHRKENEMTFH